ncbi:MAG: AmmeMemoRadiSam system protein B [Spirochaetales bacterium]|nr:AmmeMemoRadiSam system protein B [Spirochaetales bacterium]
MGISSSQDGKIRESIVNGIFYPNDPEELAKDVETRLESQSIAQGDVLGIMTPHAGYEYAGNIMAAAFQATAKRPVKNVVILAPIHHERNQGIYFPESKFFLTPLGAVTVNLPLIKEILSCGTGMLQGDIPHLEEHCIEVQLPFIRFLFPQAQIVPVLLGDLKPKHIKLLRNSLQLSLAEKMNSTLFVISANLTAMLPKERADKEAALLLDKIQANAWEEILELKAAREISSCGTECLASFLSFNGFNFQPKLLQRGNSGEVNKDSKEIVHYAGISFNNSIDKP